MTSLNSGRQTSSSWSWQIWLAYIAFVIYGSLVPLDFHPLDFQDALKRFIDTPMLNLGVESRADWIANGVLYFPVGFFTTHLLIHQFPRSGRFLSISLSLSFSIALAVGVEFAQLYFPARTVSLNDLLAEGIGAVFGTLVAFRYSEWFKTLIHGFLHDARRLTELLGESYVVAYIAFCLFPYDILLSSLELRHKIESDLWGWLLAGSEQRISLVVIRLAAEIVLSIPLGLLLGFRSRRLNASYGSAAVVGIALGGFIEVAQLFTASGVSQGLSVLTRILGVCMGFALWKRRNVMTPENILAFIHRHRVPIILAYLAVLLHVSGWFAQKWNGIDFAVEQFRVLHFLPFYYHYYTTEAKALFSLGSVCVMYAPIGILAWSLKIRAQRSGLIALSVATVVEAGKMFSQATHADPTNLLLAWAAASLTTAVATKISRIYVNSLEKEPDQPPTAEHQQAFRAVAKGSATGRNRIVIAFLLPILAFAAYKAVTYPGASLTVTATLLVSGVMVWLRPSALPFILSAGLPIFDLAPLSGRFFLDEFDLLVIICLSIAWLRVPNPDHRPERRDMLLASSYGIVFVSFAVSALVGLMPWQSPDANAFTNYYSQYNSIRIFKGALWALLTSLILRRMVSAGTEVFRPFAGGIVLGLFITVAAVIWERLTFAGLQDFASNYRVIGLISAMHTGGAYIECFLATACPYLLFLISQAKRWPTKILGSILFLASTYAIMVTFSRGGYVAFAAETLAFALFMALRNRFELKHALIAAPFAVGVLGVVTAVLTGQFAQQRLASIRDDLATRQAHWQDALDMRPSDLLSSLFGMGLGRFPQTHYLFSKENNTSATYRLVSSDKGDFLRLTPGQPIYLEQVIAIEPKQKYLLSLDIRSDKPNATMAVSVCEKWLLNSFQCAHAAVELGAENGAWHHYELPVDTVRFDVAPWYASPPIKLALSNSNGKAMIDIDNVALLSPAGNNLVRNGDFSKDLDYWFFSTDNHLQWHIKSLPVAILFDQGWFGLSAMLLFALAVLARSGQSAMQGNPAAAAIFASFSAFIIIGLFDTLIDAPRFLFLLLLQGWYALTRISHSK